MVTKPGFIQRHDFLHSSTTLYPLPYDFLREKQQILVNYVMPNVSKLPLRGHEVFIFGAEAVKEVNKNNKTCIGHCQ